MKILKITELKGATLNWAVAKALGKLEDYEKDHKDGHGQWHLYDSNFQVGGEIIDDNHINTTFIYEGMWLANNSFNGKTHIEAALRYFVWENLGDEVDVPDAQVEYEARIDALSEVIHNHSLEELYEIRVTQLENEGMTTSDAQGCADVEERKGILLENVRFNLNKQPFEYGF